MTTRPTTRPTAGIRTAGIRTAGIRTAGALLGSFVLAISNGVSFGNGPVPATVRI